VDQAASTFDDEAPPTVTVTADDQTVFLAFGGEVEVPPKILLPGLSGDMYSALPELAHHPQGPIIHRARSSPKQQGLTQDSCGWV